MVLRIPVDPFLVAAFIDTHMELLYLFFAQPNQRFDPLRDLYFRPALLPSFVRKVYRAHLPPT